jgi:hypothetical protein
MFRCWYQHGVFGIVVVRISFIQAAIRDKIEQNLMFIEHEFIIEG